MDPLSVTAGVFGILTAAGKLISTLYSLSSAIEDAADDTNAAAAELGNITIIVQSLQTYVIGRKKASPQRLQLITVEHITATLTGCIVTYSELDAILGSLHVDSGLKAWDRARWYLKRDQVAVLTQRLQNHKATFVMMLNIVQCSSMTEAERNMDNLCNAVNEILRTNQELSMRLRNMEDLHSRSALAAPDATADTKQPSLHGSTTELSRASVSSHDENQSPDPIVDVHPDGSRPSAFEEQLHRSRVYRHVSASHSETSLTNDARSTLALSICSSLTLGDVSNISVYALPIFAAELSNGSCYDALTSDEGEGQDSPHRSLGDSPKASRERRDLAKWWRSFKRSDRQAPDEESSSIFGVVLATSIRYANVGIALMNNSGERYIYGYIPIIVAKCCVFLKENGTDVPYIFEQSGSPIRVQRLQQIFDMPPRYGKGHDWTGFAAHDAASILVRYILQLPEPVIPLIFYEKFRAPLRGRHAQATGQIAEDQLPPLDDFDEAATLRSYQLAIDELTSTNRQCLLYMLDFLSVFASQAALNLMTTAKLAAIFQPGILSHPEHKLSPQEKRLSQDVLVLLIEKRDVLVFGDPPTGTSA